MSPRMAIGACAPFEFTVAAFVFLILGMAGRPARACQCERYSTCNEVAATNLVFIGTVESVDPIFLNRWNDTSQTSLRSLNDAFLRAQEHPSPDALAHLKDAYLKTFPEASADRKKQSAECQNGCGRGGHIQFQHGRDARPFPGANVIQA